MPTSNKDVLDSIDRKLSILINLIAYQVAQGKTVAEGAPLLTRLGFRPIEIAEIFGSSPKAISVRLAESRRKPQSRKSE